ncbi:uncharacterized protein L203_101804 [Cryptococcus depauperatus CBS 7841]|uniref:Uncharacterized protein n=1 Tax=Cryptococcus depauperatus CBS 7841 TaxID=1295531 RepID=A0A1E3IGY3_9TREE|nr:hypothetical protein L203_03043 [Cryptococcus depauperatus CBS 7841]
MSRHRFVRNLDLDEEMDDGEEEVSMTQEEAAQMAKAIPIVRNLLKDIKPPIADDAIADSLWHYWFDAEKAAAWLRQDREKQGEAPPLYLVPTPAQEPRKRPYNLLSASVAKKDELQPPLTALQRLSLARRQNSSSSTAPSLVSSASNPGDKQLSKLAILAQKRKETAQAISSEPAITSSVISDKLSLPINATQTSGELEKKPLSKLAQKMAAAKAAREAAVAAAVRAETDSRNQSDGAEGPEMELDGYSSQTDAFIASDTSLFSSSTSKSKPTTSGPSSFFSVLTSTCPTTPKYNQTQYLTIEPAPINLHAPLVTDVNALVKRFADVFVESPDEFVLRKRQGRAGTVDIQTAIKKQATGFGIKPKAK